MEFTSKEIINYVDECIRKQRGKSLDEKEIYVIEGAWEGRRYKEIAKKSQGKYRADTLRKSTGYALWNTLTDAWNTKVTFKNFPRIVKERLQNPTDPGVLPNEKTTSWLRNLPAYGEASTLLDREEDLKQIFIEIHEGRKVITLCAPAGQGKSWLIQHLFNYFTDEFTYRTLKYFAADVPSLEALYVALKRDLEGVSLKVDEVNGDKIGIIGALLQQLQAQKCLLVFEETEKLLQSGALSGQFLEESIGYEELLSRIIEDPQYNGCIIWIGREKCNPFFKSSNCLYHHVLKGFSSASAKALVQQSIELIGTEEHWQSFNDFCGGNPALLKILAESIAQFHEGSIANFLVSEQLISEKAAVDILSDVWSRLSPAERSLLTWLTVRPRRPGSLDYLTRPDISLTDLRQAWSSLSAYRQIIGPDIEGEEEFRPNSKALQIFVAQQLQNSVFDGLQTSIPDVLCHYPMLEATSPAHQQAQQRKQLLEPIAKRIWQTCHRNSSEVRTLITNLIFAIKEDVDKRDSYAAGNLLNIAGCLGVSLNGVDFSGISIKQADLRKVELYGAFFRNCQFTETIFPEGLTAPLFSALSPHGDFIAVGDAEGRILRWKRIERSIHLDGFCKMSQGITAMVFDANDTLLLASGREVRYWLPGEQEMAPETMIASNSVIRLAGGYNSLFAAAGLVDGKIVCWNDLGRALPAIAGHTSPIQCLSCSSDGQYLASVGGGNRVQQWRISSQDNMLSRYREIPPSWLSGFWAVGWEESQLILAEVDMSRICLQKGEEIFRERKIPDGSVLTLAFSGNMQYLAGSSNTDLVFCWSLHDDTLVTLPGFGVSPVEITLSNDGRFLLTNTKMMAVEEMAAEVQLWDMNTQLCLWETSAHSQSFSYQGLDMHDGKAIPEPTQALLQDLGVEL